MGSPAPTTLTDDHHAWVADMCGVDPRTCARPARSDSAPVQASDPPPAGDDGSSLIKNADYERLLEAMEDEADDAAQQWKDQAGDSVFTYLAADIAASYREDEAELEKARGAFNGAWNDIVAGHGDAKKLLAAYDVYSLRLGALVESNAQIEGLIALKLAVELKAVFLFLLGVSKFMLAHRLQAWLKKLKADLETAESAVKDVTWKRRLNVLVTVITLVAAPESALARLALAGGAITAHLVIDGTLGSGSAKGKLVFVGGDGAEIAEHFGEHAKDAINELGTGGKKFFGAAAGVVTLKLDTDELDDAKAAYELVKQDLKDLEKAYNDLMAGVLPMTQEFISLDTTINRLNRLINDALAASADAAATYKAIRPLIEDATRASGS